MIKNGVGDSNAEGLTPHSIDCQALKSFLTLASATDGARAFEFISTYMLASMARGDGMACMIAIGLTSDHLL